MITGPALPDVKGPPEYPPITGWADYSAALEQQNTYVACHQTSDQWKGECIDGVVGETLFKKAAVLGTGYTWNKQERTQNAFILWHTGGSPSPTNDWPGSPLCLGHPSEATSKAVVFQNFQRMCLTGDRWGIDGDERVLIKAGFVLPVEIRASDILEVGNN